jgi:hypothetical protein
LVEAAGEAAHGEISIGGAAIAFHRLPEPALRFSQRALHAWRRAVCSALLRLRNSQSGGSVLMSLSSERGW